MVFAAAFFLEIIFVFFLSRLLSSDLSSLLLKVTKSKSLTIHILSFLFLPGVIVHELSHLLTGGVLFVPVGEIEFLPKITGNRLKLGSVQIANTDPIRRFAVGFAPLVAGLSVFLLGAYYLIQGNTTILAIKAIISYFLFAVINTMFSSRKDMEGALSLGIVLGLIAVFLYILGLRLPMPFIDDFLNRNIELVKQADLFLFVPILIDGLAVGTMRLINN